MSSPEEFFARVPRAPGALTGSTSAAPGSPFATWRAAWRPRHTIATLGLTALGWPALLAHAHWPAGVAAVLLAGAISLVGAVVVASYVPSPKALATAGACAAMPLAGIFAAVVLFGRTAEIPVSAWLSLAVVVVAAAQRFVLPNACR